jgi:hypothetical protein
MPAFSSSHVYFENELGRRSAAKLLTKDEALRPRSTALHIADGAIPPYVPALGLATQCRLLDLLCFWQSLKLA